MIESHHLVFKASLYNLSLIREKVQEIISRYVRDSFELDKVILSLDEAITNIIKYAYSGNEDEDISINVNVYGDKIEFVIKDKGPMFDPTKKELPDLEEHVRSYKSHGLGIYIYRTFMDRVEYYYDRKEGNVLKLIKYI